MQKNFTSTVKKYSAINDIADNGPPEMAWDAIAPTIEEGNVQSVDDDQIIICNVDSEDEDNDQVHDLDSDSSHNNDSEKNVRKNKLSTLFEREAQKDIMSNSEYCNHLRNLNDRQCQIVMYIHSWCNHMQVAFKKVKVIKDFKIF